jgi:hypothetical protein
MSRELSQAFQSPGASGIDGESVPDRAERKVDDDGGGTNPPTPNSRATALTIDYQRSFRKTPILIRDKRRYRTFSQ